jgi:putative DNA methylase
MNQHDDKRLIEDYLPIEAISAEASRERAVRKGHISTLHLWWARRPLVACRAAVYGALVPASQFIPDGAQTDEKKKSLGRANAAKFVKSLCQYPGTPHFISEAQQHIRKAHAERLTREIADWKAGRTAQPAWIEEFKFNGESVSVEDISAGRAPRPRVLDMFAGGGAIPLEALRLGCEAYAMDLNPVAHVIELCTLVYPQKYGKPDPNARGMTGPKDKSGETTWGGLAEEVRYWGNWVLKKVTSEIGDLYPLIPDPAHKGKREQPQTDWLKQHDSDQIPLGYLMPVAYLWTRTVQCKNPACKATVPLLRNTWLCKKSGRYVAMEVSVEPRSKQLRFKIVEAHTENGLGFDPDAFSKSGNATCINCGTVADIEYVKSEGWNGRLSEQSTAIACVAPGREGKVYLSADDHCEYLPRFEDVGKRLADLATKSGLSAPDEPIANLPADSSDNTLGITVRPYGIRTWSDIFNTRQLLSLLTIASQIRDVAVAMSQSAISLERAAALRTLLACVLDKQADRNSRVCVLLADGGRGIKNTFSRQALPMVWDYAEANPLCEAIACWKGSLKEVVVNVAMLNINGEAHVTRGNAATMPFADVWFDAVITDPPYYDNVPYADISDFFFVWLKRSVGDLYPKHFATRLTPKKQEAIADAGRHSGDRNAARRAYEQMMLQTFMRAWRVLKPAGQLTVVYAHKTTLGWATLIDALRRAGFTVVEAWPLDTETSGRLRAQNASALASSIFLVAKKRAEVETAASYETDVRPELDATLRERVETLWQTGISGADLLIACVGSGLRAFTRFARVEYANGEEVPAERFLTEVEMVVLDSILQKLSKAATGNGSRSRSLAGLDPATRFYVLWRYTYGAAELDAGEAIVFANGTHVELDGPLGLSTGSRALVEKKKGKYKLHDFAKRGDDDDLGLPDQVGGGASLIDALHRTLWLLEKQPAELANFLRDSQVNREQLRLVAQALVGPALKGGELENISPNTELSALAKLIANWQNVIEGAALTTGEKEERRTGQKQLI